jgi:hypothetical protein
MSQINSIVRAAALCGPLMRSQPKLCASGCTLIAAAALASFQLALVYRGRSFNFNMRANEILIYPTKSTFVQGAVPIPASFKRQSPSYNFDLQGSAIFQLDEEDQPMLKKTISWANLRSSRTAYTVNLHAPAILADSKDGFTPKERGIIARNNPRYLDEGFFEISEM